MTDTSPAAARDARGSESARDARGRFQPGQSGNPAGKKPGTLNHATHLKRLLGDEEYDRVARTVIDAACDGHTTSARFLMERLVPKARGRGIALDLPPGASRAARLSALVDQMCAGEISADEAKAMIAVIDAADRADHATRRPEQAAPAQAPPLDPSPARGGGKGGGADGDAPLHFACMSPLAKPPSLRARLLQSTCISTPAGMFGIEPADVMRVAAKLAARDAVAILTEPCAAAA